MSIEQCYPFNLSLLSSLAFDCFALDKTAPKYFGFAELISGLALTLVVWTIADLRYKLRIETAALPVRIVSIVITIVVGVLALMSDHWRASQSRVPAGGWLTPESWQLILGGGFFLILAAWLWVAFFRPPRFNERNASRFSRCVERQILRGSPTALAVLGDELSRSVSRIVKHLPVTLPNEKITKIQAHASCLLMAMGSPKFCRAMVEGSPRLIINLFNAVSNQRKYSKEIDIISKNLVTAAIENRNSFLYHEQDFYTSGLEGVTRPVTRALCQSPELIRNVSTLLAPEYSRRTPWDLDQWEAYFRLVLEAFTVHVGGSEHQKPASLHWAYLNIEQIYSDLTEDLQLSELRYGNDLDLRLRAVGALIKDMVTVLDDRVLQGNTYVDHAPQDIAKLILSLINAAASVRKPRKVSRKIQHELIWSNILNSSALWTETGKIILKIVHTNMLNSVMQTPNLDSVRLVGYCLNVMGFQPSKEGEEFGSAWRDFHVDFIAWVTRDIASLLKTYPRMSQECFVDGMSFDEENNRLVIMYAGQDGSNASAEYLEVDPARSPQHEKPSVLNPRTTMGQSSPTKSERIRGVRFFAYLLSIFQK